jgi:hypothetical protein
MIRAAAFVLLVAGSYLQAQKTFEGTVVFTTKLEGAMAEQMGDMLKGQLPEKMITYYRGNKSRSDIGESSVIVDAEGGSMYLLNPSLQTYQKAPLQAPKEGDPQPKVTKTKEKTKILGHAVEKYIVEVQTEQGPMKMEVWAAPNFRVPETLNRANGLTRGAKVEGLPLRISMEVPGIDLKITFLATQLSQTPPDESFFRIPEGYVEEKSDASSED